MANVGTLDRLIRLVLGAAAIGAAHWSGMALFANPIAYWLCMGVGLILIATAALRTCPIYAVLGWNSCSIRR